MVLSFPHDSCSAKLWSKLSIFGMVLHHSTTTLRTCLPQPFISTPALPEQKPQHPAAGLKRDISLCFQLESFSEVFLCFLWIKSSSPCLAFELQHCVLTIYLLFPVCCVIVSMSACWKQVGRTRSTLRSRMELVKGTSHTVESCAECFFFEIWPV